MRPTGDTPEAATGELVRWGWSIDWSSRFAPFGERGWVPGRVAVGRRDEALVATEIGMLRASVTGRLRHEATGAADFPAAGDWVALVPRPAEGTATIHAVLPRATSFIRADELGADQVLAANVDTVFLVASLNRDFNPARLERYAALAWSSGARPAIVLNKADLADDVPARIADAAGAAPGMAIHAVSAATGAGVEQLAVYLGPGQTVALLGSSGVGKSTLANRLLGRDRQPVRAVREDDARGRHTTTERELIPLPSGGLLLDTPGLRAVGLWEAADGIRAAFADVIAEIEALAERCRFRDCLHESEPGCAVRAAIERGELDPDRLASMRRLEREERAAERRNAIGRQRAEVNRMNRRFGRLVRDIEETKRGLYGAGE
jgi:ribosome biogenesis GTPase